MGMRICGLVTRNYILMVLFWGFGISQATFKSDFKRFLPGYNRLIPGNNKFKPLCSVKGDVNRYKSPINIPTNNVFLVKPPRLVFTKDHWSCALEFELNNNDYYADYKFDEKKNVTISGGPLCGNYKMYGYHFHWSDAENNGAEHSINHEKYAAEAHLVYYNDKYDSFNTAARSPNGIAVIGFLIKATKGKKNDKFTKLIADVSKVQEHGPKVDVKNVCLDVFKTVTSTRRYFYYSGSLTNLGGNPATWIVYKQPILVTNDQLDIFRKMKNSNGRPLSNIYPIQPLNRRTVYEAIFS